MKTDEIKWECKGTLQNGQELVTLFTVKLEEPVEDLSEEYFEIRSEVLRNLNREVIRPVQVYAVQSNNSRE